eukprot:12168477-Karenia_brevis.AAC.1
MERNNSCISAFVVSKFPPGLPCSRMGHVFLGILKASSRSQAPAATGRLKFGIESPALTLSTSNL